MIGTADRGGSGSLHCQPSDLTAGRRTDKAVAQASDWSAIVRSTGAPPSCQEIAVFQSGIFEGLCGWQNVE